MAPTRVLGRSWATIAIIVLLVPHLIGIFWVFPRFAFTEGDIGLRVFAVLVAIVTLLTFAGLWLGKPWALWTTLAIVSFKITMELFAWTKGLDRTMILSSLLVLAAITVLIFREAVQPTQQVSRYQRILFGFVLAFAAWVAVWGLLFPAHIGATLALKVPPLHARILGAMYLSGSAFMLLGMLAKEWHEIRVVTVILVVWTGLLGIVSAFYLPAFDWSHGPTWFWFVAYVGFPLIGLWVAWCQRTQTAHPKQGAIPGALRIYLYAQGAAAAALAFCLLVAPAFMATVWPWGIPVMVAHIYGAPFLAYGVGALYAARQRTWSEVRITVIGTLVFAVAVLTASLIHFDVFNIRTPSALLWFGGFGIASLVPLLFLAFPALRAQASS